MKRILFSLWLLALISLPVGAQPKQIVVEGVEAPQSANLAPVLVAPLGHVEAVADAAITPDERFTLSAAWDGTLRLWELSTGREVRVFKGHQGQVWSVDIAPDGLRAVSSGGDGTMKIWDLVTGELIQNFDVSAIQSLKITPDGKHVFAGSSSGGVKFYGLYPGSIEGLRDDGEIDGDYINRVAVSRDGKRGLTANSDKTVSLWDLESLKLIKTLVGHSDEVKSVAFNSDGTLAASCSAGSRSGEVIVWNLQTGQKVWTGTGGDYWGADNVVWSRDGRFVWQEEGSHLIARDAKTGKVVGSKFTGDEHDRSILSLTLFPGGTRILTTSNDQSLHVWKLLNGMAKSTQVLTGVTRRVSKMALSPDGRQWLCGLENSFAEERIAPTPARLWDATTGHILRDLPGNRDGVQAVAWSGNSNFMITVGWGGGLHFWDAGGKKLRDLEADTVETKSVALNADGTRALADVNVTGERNTVRLYDTKSGKTLKQFEWPRGEGLGYVEALIFSPDERKFVSAGRDGTARLWNLETGELKQEMRTGDALLCAALSSDGQMLATGSVEGDVILWDAESGQRAQTLRGHRNAIRSVAFSPDNQTLASASSDHDVFLWDMRNGDLKTKLQGHDDYATNVVWAKNGKFLWSAGNDNTIRLWSAQGQHLLTYLLLRNSDWLAYTPDGFFDGSPGGVQKVHFTRGLQTYSLDQFYEQFYQPNLLAIALNGEAPTASQGSVTQAVLAGAPPLVRIVSPVAGASASAQIEVIVEAREQNNGGVKAIRLYQNGRLVGGAGQLRGIVVEAAATATGTATGNGSKTQKFSVTLAPGANVLRAVAYSSTDVESRADEVNLSFAGATQKPSLRVLVVGINVYRDATMNLSYARPDAEALAQFFETTGKNSALFGSVTVNKLVDEAATAEAIKNGMAQLAAQSQPEDVAFIYLAGHGDTAATDTAKDDEPGAAQNFYFLPTEMRQMMMKDRIRQFGISGKTIDELVSKIPARKIVLIYDSCKSGAAITGATRGAGDEQQALAQLARAQGIYVLAAATGQQYAGEVKALGHGILTYALLEGLGGKAAGADSLVKVSQLFAYADDRVPALTKEFRGREQWPVSFGRGQNFPLVSR